MLAPFNSFPRVCFEGLKLGSSATRRVTVQNPTQKRVKVTLSGLPKAGEAGFEVDFAEFSLGPQQEASIRVGWVPRAGGNITEKVGVKYGPGLQARIVLVGSCQAPREKPARRVPGRAPLGHNSSNMQRTFTKKDPVPAVKAPPLPENPVKRAAAGEAPEVRSIPSENMPPPPATKQTFLRPGSGAVPESWSPQKLSDSCLQHDVEGTAMAGDDSVFSTPAVPTSKQQHPQQFKLPSPLKSNAANIRRETFVAAKPSPPKANLMRKDTYTVKSRSASSASATQRFSQRQDVTMSFVSSTPAGKATEGDPRFGLNNISVIQNVAAATTEGSGEKRSSCKELKFPSVAKERPASSGEAEEAALRLRRETFVAANSQGHRKDSPKETATAAASALNPKMEELTKPVNVSDIVNDFINLDDSQAPGTPARKDAGTPSLGQEQATVLLSKKTVAASQAISVHKESEEIAQTESETRWTQEDCEFVEEVFQSQKVVTTTTTTVEEQVQREVVEEVVHEFFAEQKRDDVELNTPSPFNVSDMVESQLRQHGVVAGKHEDEAPMDLSTKATAMTDSRETYVLEAPSPSLRPEEGNEEEKEVLQASGGDIVVRSPFSNSGNEPMPQPAAAGSASFNVSSPSLDIMPTLEEADEEETETEQQDLLQKQGQVEARRAAVTLTISPPRQEPEKKQTDSRVPATNSLQQKRDAANLGDSRETYIVSPPPDVEEVTKDGKLSPDQEVNQTNVEGVSLLVNVSSSAKALAELTISPSFQEKPRYEDISSDEEVAEHGDSRETYVVSPMIPDEKGEELALPSAGTPGPAESTNVEAVSLLVNISSSKRTPQDLTMSMAGSPAPPVEDACSVPDIIVTPSSVGSASGEPKSKDSSPVVIGKPEFSSNSRKSRNGTSLEGASMMVNLSKETTVTSKKEDSAGGPGLSDSRETYVLCQSPCREADLSGGKTKTASPKMPPPAQESRLKVQSAPPAKGGNIFGMSISPPARPRPSMAAKAPPPHAATTERKKPPQSRTTAATSLNRTTTEVSSKNDPNETKNLTGRKVARPSGSVAPPVSAGRPVRQLPLARKPRPSMHRLTLIKPQRNAKSASVVRNPNPFASKNIYYDERWVEKQESGFMKWLNFVLTPDCLDEEEGSSMAPGKLDVAKLWRACSSEVKVPRAPTKEVLSVRAYTVRREMNRLRRRACMLWQTPAVAKVIARMETEVGIN